MPRPHRRFAVLATTVATVGALALAAAPPSVSDTHGSATSTAKRAYTVTAAGAASTLTLGDTTTVRGKVTPAAPRQTIAIQQLVRGKFTTLVTRKLTKKSTYKAMLNPTKAGSNQFRICKTPSRKVDAGCSAPVKVAVFRWHYLTDLDAVDEGSYMVESDPISINGTSYKKSIVSDSYGTTFIEYNLNRKCSLFKGTLGVEDNSQSAARGSWEILTDGNSRYNESFVLGRSTAVNLDVSNTLRIRLEPSTTRDYETYAMMGIGSPQVYCSF